MVARFRCLSLGELPDHIDPVAALRAGVDGLVVDPGSSVVATQSFPYALHLSKGSSHDLTLDAPKQLQFEARPLIVVEPNISAPADSAWLELRRSERRVVGPYDTFPLVRLDGVSTPEELCSLVRAALERAIETSLRAARENTFVFLDDWDGWNAENLRALSNGLVAGARALPAKPPTGYYPAPRVAGSKVAR